MTGQRPRSAAPIGDEPTTYGEVGYEEYRAAAAKDDLSLQGWDQIPHWLREAWDQAAMAIVSAYQDDGALPTRPGAYADSVMARNARRHSRSIERVKADAWLDPRLGDYTRPQD